MQLTIDAHYYNKLYIEGFSRMMKDPSYCYKFYWLEAIVQLISENKTEATYDEIIDEMISNAWYSVLEFHIHLSGIWGDGGIKDNLERAVVKLRELSGLEANASKVEIKNAIKQFNKQLHAEKQALTLNVPYKALSGFANKSGERISLDSSAGRMIAYYNRLSASDILLPYTLSRGSRYDSDVRKGNYEDPDTIVENNFRVLLTRARKELILLIPRDSVLDETYQYFIDMGMDEL